ncbi:MAG: DUF2185 domain-containing protein [Aerococcus sp.]|nr:DUF2185 domain-containing protein [Aerococcus sp.]
MKIHEWFPQGTYSLISKRLSERGGELLWAWRESPNRPEDSGWRFLSLHDTQQSLKREAPEYIAYADLVALEPAVAQIFAYPVGTDLQLARKQGEKFFVYNDTFQQATPAERMEDLPSDEVAFSDHFPKLAQLLEQKRHYQIDQHELEHLNQATEQIEQLIHILLGTRIDTLSASELYLLIGIVLGFQEQVGRQESTVALNRLTNFLLAYLHDHFDLALSEGQQIVQAYQETPAAVHQQLLAYGHAFYQWVQDGKLAAVNQEYQHICQYYLSHEE